MNKIIIPLTWLNMGFAGLSLLLLSACSDQRTAVPIASAEISAPAFIGQVAQAKPIAFAMAEHPFMARQGENSMHADSASSDAHRASGPLGKRVQVLSRQGTKMPGGQCATLTFNEDGQLLILCAAISGFRIHLIEPDNLDLLAVYKLPIRPSTIDAIVQRDKRKIMEDSSGAYFYLDKLNRVVMADSSQTIQRIAHRKNSAGEWEFYNDGRWDLSQHVPHDCTTMTNWEPEGECDPITAVMPDWQGLVWWVTRHGRLGTLNMATGVVQMLQLAGEEIQNGFSVAEDGVYIVSDHAMYRFSADAEGRPQIGWRESYDRGSERKIGTINQGSGTTPTLLGTEYVTITDNADERINVLVYKRQQDQLGERLVCRVPVFQSGHSVTDNSMIGFNRSIILENNAGYSHAMAHTDWANTAGGISRIDIREDESGCDIVWTSSERIPSVVPKLSLANGLAYFYSFTPQDNGENAWYLTALDVDSGQTQFKVLTGAGKNYDNNWAPITLGPDGTAYIGTLKGLVAVRDGK
jgi:hypothetical protein